MVLMQLPIKRRQDNRSQLSKFDRSDISFPWTVDRLFNELWRSLAWPQTPALTSESAAAWWPKADIVETDKEYKVKLNIPGVDPSKVDIEVDNNSLIVSGQTEKEEEVSDENWYRLERESGEFRRVFEFASDIDVDNVKAESKHGTLTIILPKTEAAQKKKVEVEVKQ